MIRIRPHWFSFIAILPMGVLLGIVSAPLVFLIAHLSMTSAAEWSSFGQSLRFAIGGAAISTVIGGAFGILAGTREFVGRRWLFSLWVIPIVAPPAFWWIGAVRLTTAFGNWAGISTAALVAGVALSPVTLLLVFAAVREIPSNLYEAARLSLAPITRVRAVLLPLLKSPLAGGFILTVILLLGESEIPFLFGFRTLMTDVVTTFSQTFDIRRTLPIVLPLLLVILVLGLLAGKPLVQTVLPLSRGSHGIVRRPGSVLLSLCAALPAACLLLSVSGYALPIIGSLRSGWPSASIDFSTVAVSVVEPVVTAWMSMLLVLFTVYPARRSPAMRVSLWLGLLLFCVPAAIYAIGWIGAGAMLGGLAVPPVVAYASRTVALCTLGFAVGYSRLPASLENAARLVQVSAVRRAFVFVLPLMAPSMIACSALASALTYADRDVASLLLAPGSSRLMLNLYLASANAPSLTISLLAFAVLGGAALTVAIAAAGPALLWRRRA